MRTRVVQPVSPDTLDEIVSDIERTGTVTQIVEVGNEWWIIHEGRQSRPATKAKQTRASQ